MKSAVLFGFVVTTGAAAFLWGGRDESVPEPSEAPAEARPVDAMPGEGLPPGHPPIDQGDQPSLSPDAPLPPGHPPIAGGEAPPSGQAEAVPPAQNGHTVAQIVRDARALEGKKVKVAARVMRSTPNVLGKTWLRVQDGSGQPDQPDHELVVTTQATPAVGDIVELEGTVVRDKDLGSGYRYEVLLEDATVQVKKR